MGKSVTFTTWNPASKCDGVSGNPMMICWIWGQSITLTELKKDHWYDWLPRFPLLLWRGFQKPLDNPNLDFTFEMWLVFSGFLNLGGGWRQPSLTFKLWRVFWKPHDSSKVAFGCGQPMIRGTLSERALHVSGRHCPETQLPVSDATRSTSRPHHANWYGKLHPTGLLSARVQQQTILDIKFGQILKHLVFFTIKIRLTMFNHFQQNPDWSPSACWSMSCSLCDWNPVGQGKQWGSIISMNLPLYKMFGYESLTINMK